MNMMEEPLAPQARAENKPSSHIVHALLQFAMAVRHRKTVVIVCVFVCLVLGSLYYATATRLYSARAELFILASGDDTKSTGIAGQGSNGKNLMQTFERLISSSNVVADAVERLRPEDRVDLADVPRSKWVETIQKNLSAKSVYGTNNIEIEYLSRDPAAAVAVVNQVVESYLAFMDILHKRTAEELIAGMQEQQAEISRNLEGWRVLLEQKRAECGDYVGADADSKAQHPAVERFLDIRDERTKMEIERCKTEGQLASLQAAVANGEDLQPHIMAVEESVGREMLMAQLGLDVQQREIQRQRVKDIGDLGALIAHYGEKHPEIETLRSRIRAADEALGTSGQAAKGIDRDQLAHTLIGLLRQRVDGLIRYGERLAQEEGEVRKEADGIAGQLIRIEAIEGEIEWGKGMRERLLNQLLTLSGAEDGPILRAEVVSDPVQATAPTSPNLRRVALLALLGGMAIGLAAVYVLDTLDDRFRSV